MLALTNIALRRGRKVLFENATMQLHAGQRMGVIGANGCGKSSLFAMLLGDLEPDDGELSLDAKDIIAHVAQESPHGSGAAVDYVMDGDQELREVQAAIAEREASEDAPDLHLLYERMETIDGFTAESRASRLLHGLGFSAEEYQKPVREFSGGWRMRLNLARALMCRSDILLLDEPTNHLDLPAILWLERWLGISWIKSAIASRISSMKRSAFLRATTASSKRCVPSSWHSNRRCLFDSKKRSNTYKAM